MKLIYKSIREDLDRMIHNARMTKRTIDRIILTPLEFEEFKIELNFTDEAKGKQVVYYQGIPVEVSND